MKKRLRYLTKLLPVAGALLLFFTNQANASHGIGSDITYVNTAPNVYVVNYKLYRDCGGIDPGTSQQLTYRAPGCNATPVTVTAARVGMPVDGNPYCTSIPAPPCTGTVAGLPNYQVITYAATITLPTLCPNWILSARIGNRPNSRNLANASSEYLFSEALINNVATQTNNSPTFGGEGVHFVCVDRRYEIFQTVTDADGDSVVYTLANALNDLNDPVTYGNYTGSGSGSNPYPAGVSPAGTPYPSGTFSAINPIISRTPLTIDRFNGRMAFEALDFKGPSYPVYEGFDKYTVAVQVDEYRRINGSYVKIGHIRRDFLLIVMNCGQNFLPKLDSVRARSVGYVPGAIIETGIGQPLEIHFNAMDSNPQDVLTLASNAATVLSGATFTITGGARPSGLFSWTPTAAHIRSTPYWFNVKVTDNACPINGTQTFPMGIRVTANGPTGIRNPLNSVQFTGYPNPSNTSEITFKITNQKAGKNTEVVIYNIAGIVVDRIFVKAGEEQIQWNKKDDLPAGVYFARLTTEAGSQTIKLIHLK